MFPLFFIWYKGKNVSKLMGFKKNLDTITEEEYVEHYKLYDSVAKGRKSDLNQKSIDFIFDNLKDDKEKKILDIGCGNGYILAKLKALGYANLTGCDIVNEMADTTIPFVKGNIENLPFKNEEFDIVLCNHTIEHIINSYKAVEELKRICKDKLILVTPRQRYFRYTFDLHVNFYPEKINLLSVLNFKHYNCVELNGDWNFLGHKKMETSVNPM